MRQLTVDTPPLSFRESKILLGNLGGGFCVLDLGFYTRSSTPRPLARHYNFFSFWECVKISSMLRSRGALRHFAHVSVPGRTGALAIKAGMMSEFDAETGMRREVTVLALDSCQVVQVI